MIRGNHEERKPRRIRMPNGTLSFVGDKIMLYFGDGRAPQEFVIVDGSAVVPVASAPITNTIESLQEAILELEKREMDKLLDFNLPELNKGEKAAIRTMIRPGGFDKEEVPTTGPAMGTSTAAYPRMVANDKNQPCYICGVKPNRIPVGRLERSATDHVACCANCVLYILGYTGFEADGHLTRNPTEA